MNNITQACPMMLRDAQRKRRRCWLARAWIPQHIGNGCYPLIGKWLAWKRGRRALDRAIELAERGP